MRTTAYGEPVHILLVEDNPADVRLTKEALKQEKVLVNMSVVEDGEEAMAFLRREGKYSDAKRPDIILLDLNLPRKDGREVLAKIKADEDLKRIPVLVMTISETEQDIRKAYNDYANCYITKPANFGQFVKIVNSIEDFWFTVVKLPPKS